MGVPRGVVVGAVAYNERVVPIWEAFRSWLTEHGSPTDYVLYSSYESLVESLLARQVDIAWNTNTAFVLSEESFGAPLRVLGMRDVDATFSTLIVRRQGDSRGIADPVPGRRLAVGSRDSGHASILPLYFLREQHVDLTELQVERFDRDLGKHGDTAASELAALRAVQEDRADFAAVADVTWSRLRSEAHAASAGLEACWRSPTFNHCNFTAGPELDDAAARGWSRTLLGMSFEDPSVRDAMVLEGVRRWIPGDREGYESLRRALSVSQGALGCDDSTPGN